MTRSKETCPSCRFTVNPLYERRHGKFAPIKKSQEGVEELFPGEKESYVLRAFWCDHCHAVVWFKVWRGY